MGRRDLQNRKDIKKSGKKRYTLKSFCEKQKCFSKWLNRHEETLFALYFAQKNVIWFIFVRKRWTLRVLKKLCAIFRWKCVNASCVKHEKVLYLNQASLFYPLLFLTKKPDVIEKFFSEARGAKQTARGAIHFQMCYTHHRNAYQRNMIICQTRGP